MSKRNFQLNKDGHVTYGKNVLFSIITLAAKEITGVAALVGKGIKYEITGTTINIDVFLNIFYGHTVSDVAYRVQENIKRSLESMSGYKAGTVNVNVLGVTFSEDDVRA